MPSILIYDLGIENLLYSHNLQVNTSFKEYFEENGFKTTLFNIERKTPKYSKFKLIRKLQEIIFSVKSLILNFKHLKNNQIYFICLLLTNSKSNVVDDNGNVSLLNGCLYGSVILHPSPHF